MTTPTLSTNADGTFILSSDGSFCTDDICPPCIPPCDLCSDGTSIDRIVGMFSGLVNDSGNDPPCTPFSCPDALNDIGIEFIRGSDAYACRWMSDVVSFCDPVGYTQTFTLTITTREDGTAYASVEVGPGSFTKELVVASTYPFAIDCTSLLTGHGPSGNTDWVRDTTAPGDGTCDFSGATFVTELPV